MAGSSVAAVQATNDDASASKLSCVGKGYFEDKFVKFFVRKPIKRSPIINRGYYSRWAAMRKLLLQFLEVTKPNGDGTGTPRNQILSLGAGFDTLFFQLQVSNCRRMERRHMQNELQLFTAKLITAMVYGPEIRDEGRAPHLFVEIDFLEVTSKKTAIIATNEELSSRLGPDSIFHKDNGEIHSENYRLLPADLRDLKGLDELFKKSQLDPSLPTLVLAECVLIYLEPEVSRGVVQWAAETLSTATFVVYEQIHPDDAFGLQMMKNLKSRGCSLLGLHDTPTLESKEKRFTDLGWERAVALDMDVIYNHHLDPRDRQRTERLEIFDEFEEWHIMQEHYCVSYGIKDQMGLFENFGFTATPECLQA